MARIAGVNLPNEKRMEIALRSIYGIGATTAAKILKDANVSADMRAKDLSAEEENRLRNLIESDTYDVEGELRSKIGANIKRLKDIGSYRGTRHARNLPVRGQRTKTNSRTVRGNVRKTVGSGRRSAADKT